MKLYFLLILFSGLFLFTSCEKDNPDPGPNEAEIKFEEGKGFFILNEGAFGGGNASIDYYHSDIDSLEKMVFEKVNGSKIGDVLQSMTIYNGNAYLVVNNSAYIKVVDVKTFEEKESIKGFTSPRYMQVINDREAYVSDLYANKIWLVDLENNSIKDSIALSGWTEEMLLVGSKVYVTSPTSWGNTTSSSLHVIDINTHSFLESIELKANPINIGISKYGMIQVFCQGDQASDPIIKPSMFTINPSDHSKKNFIYLNGIIPSYGSQMALNSAGDKIYLLYGGVYAIDILENGPVFANAATVEAEGRSLYGVAVDAVTGNIFVSDAKDYNSLGSVFEYKDNGLLQKEIEVGVVPSKIVFY